MCSSGWYDGPLPPLILLRSILVMIVDEARLLGALCIMNHALLATATPEVGWDGVCENFGSVQWGCRFVNDDV